MSRPLDHLVLGVPDLDAGVARFTERTGLRPSYGGRHPGGTANHLVSLGERTYLELIGVRHDAPPGPQVFALEQLREERLLTWAVRGELDADLDTARAHGLDLGDAVSLARDAPDGTRLAWRMTARSPLAREGAVPFLIDWGGAPHPADGDLPRAELLALEIEHPEPEALAADLTVLEVAVVTEGAPGARAVGRAAGDRDGGSGAAVVVRPGRVTRLSAVLGTPRGRVRVG